MLFNFLKYIRPIWYFNLKPQKEWGYFPATERLEALGSLFPSDNGYFSKTGQQRDRAYTAFQSGYIAFQAETGITIWDFEKIPVIDEYRFLRKNVHTAWVLYTLLIRLFTFHNPIKELSGFFKTRKVKRVDYSKQVFEYPEYDSFESPLVKRQPLVSIIIPTLNRYKYLSDVLRDLEQQDYKNFEVIVVDQTDPFQESFYQGWQLDLRYWYQKEKALWKARNEAIKVAKGDWILLYDDDSRIDSNWISEHLKTIDFFQADISSGVSLSVVGAEIPKHYSYFRWSDQLDTGNVLLKKTIFQEIGYFDLQFEKQRMGDGEFGLRAYLNGYKNISNPKAKRVHLKVSQGGLRQMGSWDGWRPKKLFGPRPVPSVLYLSRKYFGDKSTVFLLIKEILPSLIPYQMKGNKVMALLFILFLPLLLPLVAYQISLSWHKSTIMLQK
ncbi:MAG: glycosyltransferase family A protein [Flavobacterium sp.]|nr:glycosyltransferase family A protein [Flavobacterium sp.]